MRQLRSTSEIIFSMFKAQNLYRPISFCLLGSFFSSRLDNKKPINVSILYYTFFCNILQVFSRYISPSKVFVCRALLFCISFFKMLSFQLIFQMGIFCIARYLFWEVTPLAAEIV